MHKAPRAAQSKLVWTTDELDWFSKHSYNLSIEHLNSWTPRQSLRMLQCCIVFIDQYPADISQHVTDDLSLRKMFCEFCAATALIALARGGDHVETSLQDYLNLRKHVASFDSLLQNQLEKLEDGPAQDLLQKLSILIAFDFEAACRLKAWDDLGETILKAEICKEMRVYELMADCILCSQPPTEVLITTLKKIVNEAWGLDSLDSIKLAKYMRCLFQVALSDSPDTAAQLLAQISNLAEEASETEQPYPTAELEWVATRAFNHSVDLYLAKNDEGCKDWAGQALNIAHCIPDGGALERLLQSKWAGLNFDSD
ncbi:Sporulation-specific 22 [Hyphodiscus hymeniophilus]|uniref:Sporulation-specific 22 n=1 Tax=Hyphodiscus hymeniophilus TaxID=353542 RepID=A0A9P6SNT6_9HELO|nr:Sporulation-specific 22 [Hyphodiscus hymeniophilus]